MSSLNRHLKEEAASKSNQYAFKARPVKSARKPSSNSPFKPPVTGFLNAQLRPQVDHGRSSQIIMQNFKDSRLVKPPGSPGIIDLELEARQVSG